MLSFCRFFFAAFSQLSSCNGAIIIFRFFNHKAWISKLTVDLYLSFEAFEF